MLKRALPFVLLFVWIAAAAGATGLDFVPNVGQARDGSAFSTEIPGAHVAFHPTSLEYTFAASERLVPARMEMIGANPRAAISGTGLLPGIVNVHTGTATFSEIPTYGGLRYESVYPGIGLELDGVSGSLKSTWVVAPKADPARIRWRYHGFDQVRVDAEGNLVLTLPGEARVVTETAPIAWQDAGGQRVPVEVRYRESQDGSLSFEVGAYDRDVPLVIDPTLLYNKKLYSLTASGNAIAVDAAGNTYLGGTTVLSAGFVTKLDPGTVRRWTTYFDDGSGLMRVQDIALGPNNHVWVAGDDGGQGFTARLDNAGSILYSVPNGANGNYSVAVDPQGNSYLAGASALTKRSGTGSVVYTVPFQDLYLSAVAVDAAGNAVVAGSTILRKDVYVAVVNAGGGITRSTILGGSGTDYATGVAFDLAGRIYLVGGTASFDFPLRAALDTVLNDAGTCTGPCPDGFISVLGADMALVFSTYFGSFAADTIRDVAVGPDRAIHIAGWTEANDDSGFPLHRHIASFQGGMDAFAAKLTLHETLGLYQFEYSTPLGDPGYDDGWRLALSGTGVHVTGGSQAVDGSGSTAFVAKLHAGLLPSGDVVNINFQPKGAQIPEGYLPDTGQAYGNQGNGWSYGWAPFAPYEMPKLVAEDFDWETDQQYDTRVGLAEPEATLVRWEIALKPGRYSIRLVAGSPEIPEGPWPRDWTQVYAEGVPLISDWRSFHAGQRWVEGIADIAVSDGRLTLTLDSRAGNWMSLAFLEIGRAKAPNEPPVVGLSGPLGREPFNSDRPVTLHAEANDRDGKIQKVQFFSTVGLGRRVLLGTDFDAPYSFDWGCNPVAVPCIPGVPAGNYVIEAAATDNEGAVDWSAPVSVEVQRMLTERPRFQVELKIFLPDETIGIALPGLVARGDDRGASSTSQEYRLAQKVTVIPSRALDPDGIDESTIANLAGDWVNYERGSSVNPETGRLTLQAKSEWLVEADKGVPYMVDYATFNAEDYASITPGERPGASAAVALFRGSAPYLLIPGFCPFEWDFEVTIDASVPAAPTVTVEGWHRDMPGYEIYVDGQPVYLWQPPAGSPFEQWCMFREKVDVYTGPLPLL